MKYFIGLFLAGCLLAACTHPVSTNKFSDPVLVKIADLQDHRYTDSLLAYFTHEDARYRRDAVLAFASVQDSLAVPALATVLLKDLAADVRTAAAVALGQTPCRASAAALRDALTQEKESVVLREIVEACGKTFGKQDLAQVEMASSDTLVQQGMAWACYRLGLRGLADSTHTILAVTFLANQQPLETRLAAANFFARGAKALHLAAQQIIVAAQTDESPFVRSNLVASLRKIKSPASLATLKKVVKSDSDYRVRVSGVRAMQAFSITETKPYLLAALADENVNVAIAAAEIFPVVATANEAKALAELAKKTVHTRVRGLLYEASLKASDSKPVADEIISLYQAEKDPYAKAALLSALGQSVHSMDFISNELQEATVPVIKSTAAAALVALDENPNRDKALRPSMLQAYIKAVETGDAAVIGIVADALKNPALGYKAIVNDYTFLQAAAKKLSLPKDNEALQPLEAAIAYFEGNEKVEPVKNQFNHPIDWALVKSIPADQKVLLKTSKGDIVIRLLVEEAPGSVANFVQLVKLKYFNGKNFHRVVPNFVIQGGCNRGDGSGSEDYSIRSEFTLRQYTEGSVGMASAGKDTEGTQWFITHSPTPHLDGRYTIFAVTESGMDAVHRVEVGDKIESVTLLE